MYQRPLTTPPPAPATFRQTLLRVSRWVSDRVCLNVAGRDSRVEVVGAGAGAGAGKGRG